MKNVISFLFFSFLFFSSCTNKEIVSPQDFKDLKLSISEIESWNSSSLNTFTNGIIGEDNYYEGAINSIPRNEYESTFVSFYQKITNETDEPSAIVFLTKSNLTNLKEINTTNLEGLIAYKKSQEKLSHILYLKEDGEYKASSDFSFQVKSLTTNQIQFTLLNKIKSPSNKELSYLLILNKDLESLKGNLDQFAIKGLNYYTQSNSILRDVPWETPNHASCNTPCDSNNKGECEVYEPGLHQCIAGPCAMTFVETEFKSNPSNNSNDFNFQLFYDFRDNFLESNSIGEKYIDYYYHLSSYIEDKMNGTIVINTTNLLPEVNNMVQKLLSPNQYGNHILIDSNLNLKFDNIINEYKNLSTELEYKAVLDDIMNDINLHSNKTVNQIILDIN